MAVQPTPQYIEQIKREFQSSRMDIPKTELDHIIEWATMEFGARFMDIELTEDDLK